MIFNFDWYFQYWRYCRNRTLGPVSKPFPPSTQLLYKSCHGWQNPSFGFNCQKGHRIRNRAFVRLRWQIERESHCASMAGQIDTLLSKISITTLDNSIYTYIDLRKKKERPIKHFEKFQKISQFFKKKYCPKFSILSPISKKSQSTILSKDMRKTN